MKRLIEKLSRSPHTSAPTRRMELSWHPRPVGLRLVPWMLLAAAVGSTGCGSAVLEPAAQQAQGRAESHLHSSNGLSRNGLSRNGLSRNGLSRNGLGLSGLSYNGLSPGEEAYSYFSPWFEEDPALHDEVMRYVVHCAVPANETRSYTSPNSHLTYTWSGGLGLAPGAAKGLEITEVESQLVSACLAAHVNKYGQYVSMSVLGLDATGQPIPYSVQELEDYSRQEGCFFGDLFIPEEDDQARVMVGNDGLVLASGESTARVCTLPGPDGVSQCEPMVYAGACADFCTRDITNSYYESCYYGGKHYRPLTTRMSPQDIFICGDGTCQSTEASGMPGACAADCG